MTDKDGAMFIEDANKAVMVLNIRDLLNNKPALEQITKFEEGFLKNIQSTLLKERFSINLGNKIINEKNELSAFDIVVDNKKSLFSIHIVIDKLMKNGQSTAIFIDKKTRETVNIEASEIRF
jgi:hypothetical protein